MEPADLLDHHFVKIEHLTGIGEGKLSVFIERHGVFPVMKERDAEVVFEALYGAAQSGLRDVQFLRGRGEGAAFRDLQ